MFAIEVKLGRVRTERDIVNCMEGPCEEPFLLGDVGMLPGVKHLQE